MDNSVSSSKEKAEKKQTDLGSSPNTGRPPLRPWANLVTCLSSVFLWGLMGKKRLVGLAQDHPLGFSHERTQTIGDTDGEPWCLRWRCSLWLFCITLHRLPPPPGDKSKVQTQMLGSKGSYKGQWGQCLAQAGTRAISSKGQSHGLQQIKPTDPTLCSGGTSPDVGK